MEDGARGDRTIGAGLVKSGGVISRADPGTLSLLWAFMMPLDLALDPRSFGHLDLDKSRFIFNIVGVVKPCNTSTGGISKNSERSGTLSRRMGLMRRSRFRTVKRDCVGT